MVTSPRLLLALQLLALPCARGWSPSLTPCTAARRSAVSCAAAGDTTPPTALAQQLRRVASWAGTTVVIKYGGHAMTDASLAESFAADCALMQQLGLRLVVVHGGGPQIGAMLKRLEIPSNFVDGLRVTDPATMEVAEMVLCGSINKQIASSITMAGGRAVGLSGKDDGLVRAEQKNKALGQVGEPRSVRTELLENLLDGGVVPVVAPIAVGDDGASYNVNADTMAGAIATALQARCLLLLTDVAGVLDGEGTLLPSLTLADVSRLVDEGVVSGGMIPKLETATSAASGGVGSAVVMDGRVPHCSLVHFFGEGGVGTAVVGGD